MEGKNEAASAVSAAASATYCIRNLVEDVELRNNIGESKNVNNNHHDVDIIYLVNNNGKVEKVCVPSVFLILFVCMTRLYFNFLFIRDKKVLFFF